MITVCFKVRKSFIFLSITLVVLAINSGSYAQNSDSSLEIVQQKPRIYRSPEERRDAGIGYQLNDWLKVSSLVEVEREFADLNLFDASQIQIDEGSAYNAQLAFDIDFSESVSAEINVEIETESETGTHTFLDEAVLIFDAEPIEIELGRLSVPFGEYYSHFITGPHLEFGETLAQGAVFNYTAAEVLDISLFSYESKIQQLDAGSSLDWGANLEFSNESESIKLGFGYLTDLAESDEQLLEDIENPSSNQVGAWNAYALFGFESSEITAEFVVADEPFEDLETEIDKPAAYNIEYAYFLNQSMQLAFRYERSKEIEDAPNSQYGVNFTWRPNDYLLFSIEYLRGKFNREIDLDESAIIGSNTFAAQIAFEF